LPLTTGKKGIAEMWKVIKPFLGGWIVGAVVASLAVNLKEALTDD
jgi:hypothetical protein